MEFFDSITNGVIKLSKGSLVAWQEKSAEILKPEIQSIQSNLMKSYYTNNDESQIKIDGEALGARLFGVPKGTVFTL